ncbi:trypsin-like peptidase domain-containing protein [Profundibacter sp.]
MADRSIGRVIVKLSKGTGFGTGFVVGTVPGSSDLYFVTNQHVAEMASKFVIGFGLKDRVAVFTATVVVKSKGHDMAVLRLKVDGTQNYTPPALVLARREIEKGEQAYAIGYPAVADNAVADWTSPDGFETTLTVGRVSRVTNGNWENQDTPIEIVQHTASISGGNSGGPLLDICGRVIGVNTAFAVKGNDTYLASSSNSLGNFLRDAGIKYTSRSAPCRPNEGAANPSTGAQPDTSNTGTASGGGDLPIWGIVLIALALVGAIAFGVFTMTSSKNKSGVQDSLEDDPSMQQAHGGSSIALRLAISLPDGNRTSLAITKSMLKSGAVLGRAGSADLAIDGGKISRQHAKIYQDGRKLMVMDMGSTNGTKLNGKPLRPHQPTQINSSSRLELGSVKIKLSRG